MSNFNRTRDRAEPKYKGLRNQGSTDYLNSVLQVLFMTKEFRDAVQREYYIIQRLGIENVWKQQDAAEYFEKMLSLASPEASKEDGLKRFFSQSKLTGDNQVYCDKCEAKADTTTEWEVELYPKVLVLLLKRFEFSYYEMDYVKNDCPVDVPLDIEMPKGVSYELYATVDHVGDLRGGHYTATIQPADDGGCWYDFNDSWVTPKNNFNPERSQNGYLLFYRKRERQISDSPQEDHHGSSLDPVESETNQNNADDGNADLTKRVDDERGDDVWAGFEKVPTNEKESREPGDQAVQQEASGTGPMFSGPEGGVNERRRGQRE
ncbi:unnamed protein product, partial [Gadus morhua 'NCC']